MGETQIDQETRDRAAAFEHRYGATAIEKLNGEAPYDRELVERTNQLLQQAGDRAVESRNAQNEQRQEYRESAAHHGSWIPGGATEAQREELRGDYQRRQEWNGLIEGGSVSPQAQERSFQDLKPPAELTKREIVTEARELHARFSGMIERFENMQPGPERTQLREEMKPLVTRENELREEYTGRVKAEVNREVSQDHVPEQIGYAR